MAIFRWLEYFFKTFTSNLISSSSSYKNKRQANPMKSFSFFQRTSVTSITLIAANWPVFVWRPWKKNFFENAKREMRMNLINLSICSIANNFDQLEYSWWILEEEEEWEEMKEKRSHSKLIKINFNLIIIHLIQRWTTISLLLLRSTLFFFSDQPLRLSVDRFNLNI